MDASLLFVTFVARFLVTFVADRTIEVEIESLTPSGDGVARAGRLRMLVPFTIPGERARVQIARRRGTEVEAVLDEIVTPSPHRVAAPCPHFGPCGGCAWQHI